MTSAVEGAGASLGFVDRAFIKSGKTATPFNNYGGEDRFWLGPEGGQFGLYFPPGKAFEFGNWQTPHALFGLSAFHLQQRDLLVLGDGLRAFFGEYLKARDFATKGKSIAVFPLFDQGARADALADFQDTIRLTLHSSTPTFGAFLTTRQLIVRPKTAALLGWDSAGLSPTGSAYVATEPGRMGLLTHPVLMATMAHQDETNPVARGHLVSDKLLCLPVPPPPMAVTFPKRSTSGPRKTLRQVLEGEHAVGGCAGCHQFMDPMGWPFEVFDAVGRLRTADAGLPLDTSGNIPNPPEIQGAVAGVEELLTRLASSDVAHDCFTQHVFKYVAGVDDASSLQCTTGNLAKQFRQQGGSIPELIVATLQSDLFLLRREAP